MTRQKRQLPSVSQLRRFIAPKGRLRRDRWKRVQTFADFERLARRSTPLPVFDYVAGAAEGERAMAASVAAFDRVTFHPHVLRDVSEVDPTTTVLGRRVAMPLVLGPTGFTRMMHTAGEPAVVRAAAAADVPYTLSTLGTTGIEALAKAAPDADRWFQLYVWKDRARSEELIDRAAAAGYRTLVLTGDVPVAGARHRDKYNGLTFPPSLSVRTLARIAAKPRWLWDSLTTEPLAFESLGAAEEITDLIDTVFDPTVTLSDIEWLRGRWQGSVVIKGVQRVDDAKEIASVGVDGIALSNHGGSSTGRRHRSTCCRRSSTPSVTAPRSISTAACGRAPTSRPRLRSAPRQSSSAGRTSTP